MAGEKSGQDAAQAALWPPSFGSRQKQQGRGLCMERAGGADRCLADAGQNRTAHRHFQRRHSELAAFPIERRIRLHPPSRKRGCQSFAENLQLHMGCEPRCGCRMAGLAALCLWHHAARGQRLGRQMAGSDRRGIHCFEGMVGRTLDGGFYSRLQALQRSHAGVGNLQQGGRQTLLHRHSDAALPAPLL